MEKTVLTAGSFWGGLLTSFASTSISEVGDRSFFTATILAIRYPRFITFIATYSALLVQSLTSTTFGTLLQALIPQSTSVPIIPIASSILFGGFAVNYLVQAVSQCRANQQRKNLQQQQLLFCPSDDLKPRSLSETRREAWAAVLVERQNPTETTGSRVEENCREEIVGGDDETGQETKIESWHAQFWKIFCLVYIAEVGDTSMVVTTTLAANQNPIAVFIGAMLANGLVNGLGIWAGSASSNYISEIYINASACLLFALFSLKNLTDVLI
eukprot:Gregarina_sp_Poly_1__1679@NODE_1430_length_4167_cov_202_968780_g580_i2_p3_GENE_NODE_1430_length_4167_cov_202_968780_g580_i2NODE_1430_length_4167_cov_202_968780_g580_i2_p3_ORF_typecomplete_len271_score30_71UPF0016/PF01169_19/4_2e12UPF0016/PF01169_19/7_4e18DPM3/PF08285_11/0_53_NODE_1430_length_4167_cov_202_968780_g580_i218922704